jgi:D-3-phosphoglycerate dehydrogenase
MNNPNLPEWLMKNLQELGEVKVHNAQNLSEEEAGTLLSDTELLICAMSGFSVIGKTVLESAKKLKHICVSGVGTDWIDVKTAEERGISISTTKGSNAEAVAEHIRGMLLSLSKRISELEKQTRTSGENNVAHFQGRELYQKTIGIIGLGNIGKRVARIAKGFDMRILGYSRKSEPLEGIETVALEGLYAESDVIVLCVPLTEETENLISFPEIEKMKNGVILVNCAREKLVDKKAILQGVASGKVFGYGVETDIYAPIDVNDEYFKYPQVLLTPHNAWNTVEAKQNSLRMLWENIQDFI